MEQEEFLPAVSELKARGKSIRAIAAELGVNRGRVDRALKKLALSATEKLVTQAETSRTADGTGRDVFVGRRHEMGELRAALADALSGHGRLVMLVGQPGIGKTRTSQELAIIAEVSGAQVLWGRCYEGQGAPPYWPWIQAIRSYVRGCDPELLRVEMGTGAADIAEVVPDVRCKLTDLQPSPALDSPERARFRLFDAITTFLKNVGGNQPLVVILENLHWADHPSLLLLEFVAQEVTDSRLLVIGSYRDSELARSHPLTQTLGELAREPLFHRIALRRLSEEEVCSYIRATSGITPPKDLIEAVYTQTEGNPLFMIQVVQLLLQEGDLTFEQVTGDRRWGIRIPAEVHEAIGRRLDRLSDACNQVLSVASVVGREFELRLLERLKDKWAVDDLLEVVEEALAARVIEELPTGAGCYQFSHVLIQNTLVRELSTIRRARLHRRIAENLEDMYGNDCEAHAAELAYHFGEAASVVGTEKLVSYSLLAGERSLAIYAYEEALVYFERALAAKEGQSMDSQTAAILFGLGQAQGATGQVHEAWATLGRAFDYYLEEGNVDGAVAVAKHPLLFVSGLPLRATYLAERALKLVPADSHEAGRLLARYGLLLNLEQGNYGGAEEALKGALAIAQREKDEALEMRTLANAADADWYQMYSQEVLRKSLRAVELARRANDAHTEIFSRFLAVYELTAMGNLAAASEHAREMLAQAERARDQGFQAMACLANLFLCRHRGDWRSAREFCDRGLVSDSQGASLIGFRAVLEYQVGDFVQGEAYVKRMLDQMRGTEPGPSPEYITPVCILPMIARITGSAGQLDISETAAVAVLSSPSTTPLYAMWARFGLALVAVQRGDIAKAGEQYLALEPIVRGGMLPGYIAGDRLLGLLAQAKGNCDQATAHFEDARSFCRMAGYLPELAWSCCDHAYALLHRNRPSDRIKAVPLLEEALITSRQLGMHPLTERVVDLQILVDSQPDGAPSYPDGLTPREVEILCLIAQGKSNREIAEELVLSVRTVERHIANIYGKTNAHGRARATTYALNHHLTSLT